MPGPRLIGLAAVLGIGVAVYLNVWTGLPTFLAVGVGATMAVVLLLIGTSLAADPAKADEAWQAAAPDLAERERGRHADEGPIDPDAGPAAPLPDR